MFTKVVFKAFIVVLLSITTTHLSGQTGTARILDSFYIYRETLMPNRGDHAEFQVGVDSDRRNHNWLSNLGSFLRMEWKGGETWGAVFITSGDAKPDSNECINNGRDTLDLSMYNYLLIDMKGNAGNTVRVGIKDKCNRNDGTERRIQRQVTTNWQTYEFPLVDFNRSDTRMIHVVVEFVYGNSPAVIDVKNIRYIRRI
jgi:hypothetical protein